MYEPVIFYLTSLLIVIFAFLMLLFRNIFYSLISAILVFFMTAVLFLLLGSEYNAVIQIAVYGFAIPIILGLGIMFTNTKFDGFPVKIELSNSKYGVILVCGIFVLALFYIAMISMIGVPEVFSTQIVLADEPANTHTNFLIFTNGIFTKYIWAFELTALILTVAAAGLTIIKKTGRRAR